MRTIWAVYVATAVAVAGSPVETAKRGLASIEEPENSSRRLVQEARLQFYLGKFSKDNDEKISAFSKGLELAKQALEKNSRDPEAMLWAVANDGQNALAHGKFTALFAIKRIEKMLLELKEIAPEHRAFAADRALGTLYLEAPPVISIGSVDKAREHFESALKGAPQDLGNQVRYARFLWETHEKEKAKKIASEAVNSPKFSADPLEEQEWREVLEPILTP